MSLSPLQLLVWNRVAVNGLPPAPAVLEGLVSSARAGTGFGLLLVVVLFAVGLAEGVVAFLVLGFLALVFPALGGFFWHTFVHFSKLRPIRL